MAQTQFDLTKKAARRREYLDNLPPTSFAKCINPHIFNPSLISGDKKCLECGLPVANALHIHRHSYQPNFDSKLLKCMCGKAEQHSIHFGGH